MIEKTIIQSCLLNLDNDLKKRDIVIENGVISEIKEGYESESSFDAEGLLAIPGAIDSQVYFNDPGFIHRETFDSGTKAALKGGVTTVIDMASSNVPPVKNESTLEAKINLLNNKAYCDYACFGGITSEDVEKRQFGVARKLVQSGVCGLEVYMNTTVSSFKHLDNGHLYELMKNMKDAGAVLIIHAEDFNLCDYNIKVAKLKSKNYPRAWAEARPEVAEVIAVSNAVNMAEEFGVRLHFLNISTKRSIEVIKHARSRGVDITCETQPAYLEFSFDDIDHLGNLSKLTPPLREQKNRIYLWEAINNGTIDIIGSSHSPYEYNTEKEFEGSNIWNIYSGTPEIENLFLYMYSEGVCKHRITLNKMIEVLCINPSERFGLSHRKGNIEKGKDADIVLIDPEQQTVIDKNKMISKAKFSLFDGYTFNGKIMYTFLRGKKVYDFQHGFSNENSGTYISRQYI